LVSELRLTAGCVLMDLASPAISGTSVYANGLNRTEGHRTSGDFLDNLNCQKGHQRICWVGKVRDVQQGH